MARPLVPPVLLASLDTGLLARLLTPYRAFLEARRLALGDDSPAWRARLADVLSDGDRAMPVGLQHAFWAIGPLASPEGEAELRVLVAERGWAVPVAPGRAADVAAWAFLDERALFRDARARVCAPSTAPIVHGKPSSRTPHLLLPSGDAAPRHSRADDEGETDGKVERFRR